MSSKLYLFVTIFALFVTVGCGSSSQREAEQHAAKVDEATSAGDAAGSTADKGSMPEGCYLRAVIDGTKWEATAMTPDRAHPSIIPVNGRKDSSSIMFTISGMRDNVGQPSKLSDMNTITFWEGEKIMGAKNGEVIVTKMDDQFIEGTFNFTAEEDGKKVTCTDGAFRVPSPTTPLSN